MPLTRDKVVGHDDERMAFRFTMLNDGRVVTCQISDAAMDELAGTQGTESRARQSQFLSLRDAIEQIAADLFDKTPHVDGQVVRIFVKHIQRQPIPSSPQSSAPAVSPTSIMAPIVVGLQDVPTPLPESGNDGSQSAADSHENGELDRGGGAD